MWRGSRRRKSPHTRLVSQPPNPHVRRLSMSEDTLHHVIRWNVDIAVPVVHFLRRHSVDVLSAREEGWGTLTDSQILARAHAMGRFVLTHDADFGTLAVHRGEPIIGILYLRPGGRPPAQVIAVVQALLEAHIDWTPPVIAVYRAGRLRLRRVSEEPLL